MPSSTSRTSAPTASHRLATAFTKLSLVARKALEAYLIVSAVAASVTMSGAWVDANSAPTRAAAAWSSPPTTIRSGCRASWMAVPSRRNSGFDTTATSGRSRSCSTSSVEPTGTVDLLTTTAPCSRWGPISTATASRKLHVGGPVGALGGGHAQEDEVGARAPRRPRPARSAAGPSRARRARCRRGPPRRWWARPATAAPPWRDRAPRSTPGSRDGPGTTAVVSPT